MIKPRSAIILTLALFAVLLLLRLGVSSVISDELIKSSPGPHEENRGHDDGLSLLSKAPDKTKQDNAPKGEISVELLNTDLMKQASRSDLKEFRFTMVSKHKGERYALDGNELYETHLSKLEDGLMDKYATSSVYLIGKAIRFLKPHIEDTVRKQFLMEHNISITKECFNIRRDSLDTAHDALIAECLSTNTAVPDVQYRFVVEKNVVISPEQTESFLEQCVQNAEFTAAKGIIEFDALNLGLSHKVLTNLTSDPSNENIQEALTSAYDITLEVPDLPGGALMELIVDMGKRGINIRKRI
jgi:hypothetical protein